MPFSPYAEERLIDCEQSVQSGDIWRIRSEIDRVNTDLRIDEISEYEHSYLLQLLQEALGE